MYWLDTLLLTLIGLGGLWGLWSGFVLQMARLVSMSLAVGAAVLLNEPVKQFLLEEVIVGADPRLAQGIAYGVVALLTFLILMYFARKLRRTVRTSELAWLDRWLGFLLSAGKVTAFLAVLCLLAERFPHEKTQGLVRESVLVPVFAQGAGTTISWLPERYQGELDSALSGLGKGKEGTGDRAREIPEGLRPLLNPKGGAGIDLAGLLSGFDVPKD